LSKPLFLIAVNTLSCGSEGSLGNPHLNGAVVGGTAAVAVGRNPPSSAAGLFFAIAPADLDFATLACSAPHHGDVFWDPVWSPTTSWPVAWSITFRNTRPRIRVHALLSADREDGIRRLNRGFPPGQIGDFFTTSADLEFRKCEPESEYLECSARTGDYDRLEVLLESAFSGCGGTPGACTFREPRGPR
jgi:hypothetical protein